MRKKAVCVLVSGGLDSDVLLGEMASRYTAVHPVYIRQALQWEGAELFWLRTFVRRLRSLYPSLKPLVVLDLPMNDVYGDHWSTGKKKIPGARSADRAVFLPGRNMVLSTKAAVFAAMNHISTLALGSLDHNPFPDASPSFFRQWSSALSVGLGTPLQLIAPYRRLSKPAVIQKGKKYPLELSFSCISPQARTHCGRCNKCAERRRAFRAAHVEDKTVYARRQRGIRSDGPR